MQHAVFSLQPSATDGRTPQRLIPRRPRTLQCAQARRVGRRHVHHEVVGKAAEGPEAALRGKSTRSVTRSVTRGVTDERRGVKDTDGEDGYMPPPEADANRGGLAGWHQLWVELQGRVV